MTAYEICAEQSFYMFLHLCIVQFCVMPILTNS